MIMLQYFVKGSAVPFFPRGQEPHLKYICNVDSEASKMPRSMHEHPHLAEAVLVYKGAGIFMIGGRQYTAKEGDFIIYNSRTVHDEFGGNGTNELHTYCLGISNLYLPGQPECQLVPSGYSPIISTGKHRRGHSIRQDSPLHRPPLSGGFASGRCRAGTPCQSLLSFSHL